MLTDTVQRYSSLMLRCWVWFPRKELGSVSLQAWGVCCHYNGSLQNKCQNLTCFNFFPLFSHKKFFSSNFFQLAKTDTTVCPSKKSSIRKQIFENWEYLYAPKFPRIKCGEGYLSSFGYHLKTEHCIQVDKLSWFAHETWWVKESTANAEDTRVRVWSLGLEDPLEEYMAIHILILVYQVFLPGKSHGQRSLEGYSPWGPKRVGHDWACMMDWTLLLKGEHIAISTTTTFNGKDASTKAILWVKKYNMSFTSSLFCFWYWDLVCSPITKIYTMCVYTEGVKKAQK